MRNNFIDLLTKEAKSNNKIILMVGDLGFSVVEDFKEKYPKQFINAGVAEQNMTGMAAGLASEKFHVFTYSIANFNTFRCSEQIRNDIDYHNYNVTVVSVGGGLSYGALGYSHHAIQDYALMRSFPNMTIYAPGTRSEITNCMKQIFKSKSPAYLRLGKTLPKNLKKLNKPNDLAPGKWTKILECKNRESRKCILTTGAVIDDAVKMQKKEQFSNYHIYSLPIWGMKYKTLQAQQINKWDEIVTLEDHLEDGGFGSYILECNSNIQTAGKTKIELKSLNKNVCNTVGDQDNLKEHFKFAH